MISIGVERVSDIIETELWPLLEDHREELTTNKGLMVLAPDVPKYRAMEQAGVFVGLIARDAGRIVGYSGNLMSQHLHYCALRYASNDVLFLAKEYRRGTLGLKLMRATESEMRARGCKVMVWHAKPGTTLDELMPKLGARVQDILYTREL